MCLRAAQKLRSVAFTSKAGGARLTAPVADAADFTPISWSASIDSLPARGRGRSGRALPFFGAAFVPQPWPPRP